MIVGKICVGLTNAQQYAIYPLTAGLTGAELEIEYMHPAWKQLRKLVTFRAGKEIRSVWDETGTVEIPWEVLQKYNRVLRVGITGTSAEHDIVVPTIEVSFDQQIQESSGPGPEASDPTLPVWAQLDGRVDRLGSQLKQLEGKSLDRAMLQDAVNNALAQAKESGSFNGKQGEPGRGIVSTERTAGTGAAGATDIYTVTYTDGTTSTFTVYNGANGKNGMSGRGIVSIARTSGTGAAGSTDIYTITYTDGTASTFTVYNGANGKDGSGGSGGIGGNGADGATFIPYVDASGNLSWSNNKGLANPDTVNIIGPRGEKGQTGDTGPQGPQGPQGEPGADGKPPVRGTDYWTDADIAQIKSYVDDAILGGAW